jgi:acetate kinase
MDQSPPCILTVNGGSSSIKFALFGADSSMERLLNGRIEGVGLPKGTFSVQEIGRNQQKLSKPVQVPDHKAAVALLMDWVREQIESGVLKAVGHRVVHGGPKYSQSQRITPALVRELHELSPLDPEHLPEEILLTEAFHERFPHLPQIACFDTAFHRDMPRVAQIVAIPRRYEAAGVRRYGFHGLSCAYLMEVLARDARPEVADGRVLLAHLGNGASITAVRHGRSMDTSMGFTPTAGLPMSTRSGDLDPGVAWYLARTEGVSGHAFHEMVNHQSGLLGVSETSSDVRDLLAREGSDVRAAEALALFCYQAKKWIGALAGALGGVDTLVFAGGIGENAPVIRERICAGFEFLGIMLDEPANQRNAPIISNSAGRVSVRVIRTDEEWMIAKAVRKVLFEANQGKGSS